MRISYDFIETGNCSKKLFCVCELGKVVKTREGRCYYSCFSFGNVKEREIYWLDGSYAVDEFLQGRIDAKSLLIAFVVLKLVDGTGKTLCLC